MPGQEVGTLRLAGEGEVHCQPGAAQEPDCHTAGHLDGQGLFLTRLTPPLPMSPVASAAIASP